MDRLADLGSFGDERLKKGGPIFCRRWFLGRPPVCASLGTAEPMKSVLGDFFAIRR
jgi:hypothetical protein